MRTQALLAVLLAGVCFADTGAVAGTCTAPNYPNADIYIVEAYLGSTVVGSDTQDIGDLYVIELREGRYDLVCKIYDTNVLPHLLLDTQRREDIYIPEFVLIFVYWVF